MVYFLLVPAFEKTHEVTLLNQCLILYKTRPIAISRVLLANSDRRTDGRTDKAAYRVACTRLKTRKVMALLDSRVVSTPPDSFRGSLLSVLAVSRIDPFHSTQSPGAVRDLQFAPNGSLLLLSSSIDGFLKIWDCQDDGNLLKTLKPPHQVR